MRPHGVWSLSIILPYLQPSSLLLPRASLVAQTVKNPPSMQETWVQSLGREDSLEKGMATHSSILAWRVPRTEEPGGLQSMGSQRFALDRATHILLLAQPRSVLLSLCVCCFLCSHSTSSLDGSCLLFGPQLNHQCLEKTSLTTLSLCPVLGIYCFFFVFNMAAPGLSCGTQDLSVRCRGFSLVMAHRL